MRGLMERLFRSRAIRLALSLVLMASLVGCSTKEEISRGGSGEVTATDSGSLEIAGGHASYRVSDNAANMIESIPTGAQVSFRYFAPQLEDELASLVSICTDDNYKA